MKTGSMKSGCAWILLILALFIGAVAFTVNKIDPDGVKEAKDNFFISALLISPDTVFVQDTAKVDTTAILERFGTISKQDSVTIQHHESVPLEVTEMALYINGEVNGTQMRMCLDTGCSTMLISEAEAKFLERQGKIKDGDYGKEVQATQADGSTSNGREVVIHSVKIGTREIRDVHCMVSSSQDAAILLGHEVLSKIGKITIDYTNKQLIIE